MGEPVGATSGTCPECGAARDAAAQFCASCGRGLAPELADPPSRVGAIVGTYRLLDLLGSGGMGHVYLAEHTKLGRRVAVKMLRPEFASNPIAVSRFFAEARAVNRISHDNIVEITDFLENPGGDNCLIMEFLRGDDLGRRILRDTFLPLYAIVGIAAQIGGALAAVHAAGIVHRDLKPDNIFLIERAGGPYFVKLLDFGVAKLTGGGPAGSMRTTGLGQIIGTPEYMSPEQASGEDVDHRADIYALGVILYELVTGTLPYRAKSFGELVLKHAAAPPKRPSAFEDLPHVVPKALDELIMEMLARSADDRPHSMSDVEQQLHDLLDDMEVPPLPRIWKASGAMRTVTTAEMEAIRTPPAREARRKIATAPTLGAVPMPVPAVGSDAQRVRVTTPVAVTAVVAPVAEPAPAPVPAVVADAPTRFPVAPRRRGRKLLVAGVGAAAIVAAVAVVATRHDAQPEGPAMPLVTPPPPPPAHVRIRFASAPPGATVTMAGSAAPLGTTPFVASLPRAATTASFELSLEGYVTATEQASLDGDGAVAAALTAVPPPPPPPIEPPAPPAKHHTSKHKPAPPSQPAHPIDPNGTMDVFGNH